MCAQTWIKRESFLSDHTLMINGYQADFTNLGKGYFFFTHNAEGCNSTMALEVERFLDLNKGKPYLQRKTDMEGCPRYCLKENALDRCEEECECAFVREVIEIIAHMQKGRKDKRGEILLEKSKGE